MSKNNPSIKIIIFGIVVFCLLVWWTWNNLFDWLKKNWIFLLVLIFIAIAIGIVVWFYDKNKRKPSNI